MDNKNIESQTASTILQKPEEVVVGNTTYKVAPPSTATLILVSEAVANMPQVNLKSENIVDESLYVAKYCRIEGEIVAIMILGAKGLTATVKVPKKVEKAVERTVYDEYLFGLVKRPKVITEVVVETIEKEVTIDRKAELAKQLLEDVAPRELMNLTSRLLQGMQIADFFGLTTFLIEINLLRQTKVVETTASGQ